MLRNAAYSAIFPRVGDEREREIARALKVNSCRLENGIPMS